jgi:hypothetical protein
MKLLSITLDGYLYPLNIPVNTVAYALVQKGDRAFMLMRLLTDDDTSVADALASVKSAHPEFKWIAASHPYDKDPVVRSPSGEGGIHYFEMRRENGNWSAMYTQGNEEFIRSQAERDIGTAPPDTYMPASEVVRALKDLVA